MAEPSRPGANPALRLALIRRIHVYISVLIAPTVLLFSFTGAIQVFRVPDHHPEMATLNKLASLHKNQTFVAGRGPGGPGPGRGPESAGRGPEGGPPGAGREGGNPSPEGRPAGPPREGPPPPKPATVALQWFSSLAGLGLGVTTLLGLWMGLAYNREKKLLWALLAVGVVLPIALVLSAGL